MTIQVNITSKEGVKVHEVILEANTPLVSIGRSVSCNFPIEDSLLSKLHATLELTPSGKVLFTDNKSSNGSSAAGSAITKLEMKVNDKVRIGNHFLEIDLSKLTATEKRKVGVNTKIDEMLTLPSINNSVCKTTNFVASIKKKKY
jgi:pSer/pThr/pTyr-binding forkhead associated (FHA) protein